jgi:hypothetical protein
MPSQMRHSADGAALAAASEAVAVRFSVFSRTSDVNTAIQRDSKREATTGRAVMGAAGNREAAGASEQGNQGREAE